MSRRSRFSEHIEAVISIVHFGQFLSVGAVGTVCDNIVLLLLSETGIAAALAATLKISDSSLIVAKIVSIETAIVVMFLLNEHWTFGDEGAAGTSALFHRLGKSHIVRTGGVAVQLIVFTTVYRVFNVTLSLMGIDLWLLIANGCGIVIGMIINYISESLFTWRIQDT
ncbi:GtrA family protein [Haladaptatus pallidirubidus]|uniref:GtrA family protein n=1 Tax=Haladaptatus pallidirubidus TaxID=1008152 RepID=A0AAV3UPM4_9EURY|nr:GtrA family protein [Haladaptatus pallidirubidus]